MLSSNGTGGLSLGGATAKKREFATGLIGIAVSGLLFLLIAGGAVVSLVATIIVAWPYGLLVLLFPALIGFAVWRGWGDLP